MRGLTVSLHPEEVNPLVFYAITINLSKVSGHPDKDVEEYFKLFNMLFGHSTVKVSLRPELSGKGRLHYHGTVQFTDHKSIVSFYYEKYFKQEVQGSANILLTAIDDYSAWHEYITKQREWMKPWCQDHCFLYHYSKWFPKVPKPVGH